MKRCLRDFSPLKIFIPDVDLSFRLFRSKNLVDTVTKSVWCIAHQGHMIVLMRVTFQYLEENGLGLKKKNTCVSANMPKKFKVGR